MKNQRDAMIEAIYKALGDGLGRLIKNGTALFIMACVIVGQSYGMYYLHLYHEHRYHEIKQELHESRVEYSSALNEARRDFINCQNENRILAIQVAELKVIVERIKAK
jgi:hypothetical protein